MGLSSRAAKGGMGSPQASNTWGYTAPAATSQPTPGQMSMGTAQSVNLGTPSAQPGAAQQPSNFNIGGTADRPGALMSWTNPAGTQSYLAPGGDVYSQVAGQPGAWGDDTRMQGLINQMNANPNLPHPTNLAPGQEMLGDIAPDGTMRNADGSLMTMTPEQQAQAQSRAMVAARQGQQPGYTDQAISNGTALTPLAKTGALMGASAPAISPASFGQPQAPDMSQFFSPQVAQAVAQARGQRVQGGAFQ